MKRPFAKGDRVLVGGKFYGRAGTVIDEVTDEWLGEDFQELDIRLDAGGYIRIPDTNVELIEEEKA